MPKGCLRVIVLLGCLAVHWGVNAKVKSSLLSEQTKLALETFADDYMASKLSRYPTLGYFYNFKMTHHDKVLNNSLDSLHQWHSLENAYLNRLKTIDREAIEGSPHEVLYAQIQEELEANIGKRVCKSELWRINHMHGLHLELSHVAKLQPVGSIIARREALDRWTMISHYFIHEIDNLKLGLKQGYSAPKSVVKRVIAQIDNLVEEPSSLYSPASRDTDAEFISAYNAIIQNKLIPALKTHNYYLKEQYIDRARENRSIASNPNGVQCYEALYRGYTSLNWSPKEVHNRGIETVNRYQRDVVKLGNTLYGLNDFSAILEKNNNDPANRFKTVKEMHDYFVASTNRIVDGLPQAFASLPTTKLDIKKYPKYLSGTGRSATYEPGSGNRNGIFRYDPSTVTTLTKGSAEILTAHEGYPGHHLQIALIQDNPQIHPIQSTFENSAFIEGWARYAEALTEELGLYDTAFAKIKRRAWPARGMVSDTGLHAFSWSSDKARKFNADSGKYQGDDGIAMLDRMAAIPAQLTSYDSGAIEIFSLRRLAEDELKDKFDLKKFHTIILKNGFVPLWLLREQVEKWILDEKTKHLS